MELNLKKKSAHVSLPTKRSINLASIEQKKTDLKKAVPAFIIVIVAAILFSKFAVIDRMVKMNEAEAAEAAAQRAVDAGYDKIDSFGELTETYAHYTYSGMTDEEMKKINRIEAIDLVRDVVLPKADVEEFKIEGNKLILTFFDRDLRSANLIAQELMLEDNVEYCTVNQVYTNDRALLGYVASIDGDFVVVQITVYLIGVMEAEFDQ